MLEASGYGFTPDVWSKESGRVPFKGLNEAEGQLRKVHTHVRTQGQEYEQLFRQQQAQLSQLQEESGAMADKVHTVEDALAGSEAATKAAKAALKREARENKRLGVDVQRLSVEEAALRGALGASQRQVADTEARLQTQAALLAKTAKRSELQRLLQDKQAEKRTLEGNIREATAVLKARETAVSDQVAVVAGIAGLLTGGIGGLAVAAVAGGLGGQYAMQKGQWSCTAKQTAELRSLEEKLRLVDTAIAKLEQEIKI